MKERIDIRLANSHSIKKICYIAEKEKEKLESQGIYQWDELYPVRKDFEKDLKEIKSI